MSPLLSPSRVLLAKLGKSGLQQHNHCALLSYSKRLGASDGTNLPKGSSRLSSISSLTLNKPVVLDCGYCGQRFYNVHSTKPEELDIAHIQV
uniref:Uncharacterized protein n=1 Tax=Globodera rostochiensis TaxID=31243 RepID=A0A914GTL2_GLORO